MGHFAVFVLMLVVLTVARGHRERMILFVNIRLPGSTADLIRELGAWTSRSETDRGKERGKPGGEWEANRR